MRATCADCGRAVSEHDRHVRFSLPDPMLPTATDLAPDRVWMDGDGPARSDMMAVEDLGSFVRALVPIRLTGGYTVTFGVWVGVPHEELLRAFEIWHTPASAALAFDGRLANALPPWDVFGAPVRVEARNEHEVPHCVSSPDASMSGLLHDRWDHALVLSALEPGDQS